MSNPILKIWDAQSRCGAAVIATSGEILRTWDDIAAESEGLRERFSTGRGVVALRTGNQASFPALLLAAWRCDRAVCLCEAGEKCNLPDTLAARLGITLDVSSGPDGAPVFESTGLAPRAAAPGIDLIKLTSGTVGEPEPLAFTAAQLLADTCQVCDSMGLQENDRNFGVISFAHSYGFSNLITPLLVRGIPLVVSTDPLPRAIEAGLAAARATVLPAVPAMFRSLLACESLPESLRLCISAGAPLDPRLGRAFHERFGLKIHSFYGASECGGICYDASEHLPELPGFVGTPLRGVVIEAGDGPSRIRVRSAAVGLDHPDGVFEPADILLRHGEGFRIVGRESDILNVAGRKVGPHEIEEVLKTCPGIRDAVVCGLEDPLRGHEVCALLVGEASNDDVRRHCASRLPAWKIPRRLAFADTIPVNARGKTSRAAIARDCFSGPAKDGHAA